MYRVINQPNRNGVLEHGIYRGFAVHVWSRGICLTPLEGTGQREHVEQFGARLATIVSCAVTTHRRCTTFRHLSETVYCVHVSSGYTKEQVLAAIDVALGQVPNMSPQN